MSSLTWHTSDGELLGEIVPTGEDRRPEAEHLLTIEGEPVARGRYHTLRQAFGWYLDSRELRRFRQLAPASQPKPEPKPWYEDPRATWGT